MIKKINKVIDKKNLATALRANLTKRKQQVRARQSDLTDNICNHLNNDIQVCEIKTDIQVHDLQLEVIEDND